MGMNSTGVLIYAMPSLQRCMPCIFVIYVVTSTSMKLGFVMFLFSGTWILLCLLPAVILLPCIHVATVSSVLILSLFSKDDL